MARLNAQQRRDLPKSDFAIPGKAPGSGSYPIPDKAHARAAESRVSQFGTPAEKAQVRAAVHRRYPAMAQKSTKGSPPFTASEVNAGHRKLGPGLVDG